MRYTYSIWKENGIKLTDPTATEFCCCWPWGMPSGEGEMGEFCSEKLRQILQTCVECGIFWAYFLYNIRWGFYLHHDDTIRSPASFPEQAVMGPYLHVPASQPSQTTCFQVSAFTQKLVLQWWPWNCLIKWDFAKWLSLAPSMEIGLFFRWRHILVNTLTSP